MKKSQPKRERFLPCESCGKRVAEYDTVSCGSLESG
jgi:hypothetical protein